MFLALSTTSSAVTPANSTYIKEGTPAPYTGYLFTVDYAKSIAEGWKQSEERLKIVSRAYDDLKRESLESAQQLSAEIIRLESAIRSDVRATSRSRRRGRFWTMFGGVLLGTGIGCIIHNNR